MYTYNTYTIHNTHTDYPSQYNRNPTPKYIQTTYRPPSTVTGQTPSITSQKNAAVPHRETYSNAPKPAYTINQPKCIILNTMKRSSLKYVFYPILLYCVKRSTDLSVCAKMVVGEFDGLNFISFNINAIRFAILFVFFFRFFFCVYL